MMENGSMTDQNITFIQETNFAEHPISLQEGILIGNDNVAYEDLRELEFENEGIPIVLADFNKICRTCLTDKYELANIFNSEGIPEMIMTFCQVQLRPDDELPLQICSACSMQIYKIMAFKHQIEQVDATLREYVQREYFGGIDMCTTEPIEIELRNESNTNFQEETMINEIMDAASIGSIAVVPLEPQNQSEKAEEHQEVDDFIEDDPVSMIDEENFEGTPPNLVTEDEKKQEIVTKAEKKEPKVRKKKKRLKVLSESEAEKPDNVCTQCDKEFSSKYKLTNHLKTHSTLVCSFCEKSFRQVSELNKHLKTHILVSELSRKFDFNCKECHIGFSLERDLRIHSSIHSKDGTFVCLECKKNCETSSKLRRHVRTHFEDKPHKCKICFKGFPEMSSLTRHFRQHSGETREKKYVCKFCEKRYHDTHTLNIHIRTHTGDKPEICPCCGKSFIDKRLLNSHMKIHSNIKPFKCQICARCFTHQSTLTTHVRTHTGEKPYICPECGKSFIQSSNLVLHMRIHSGVRPYSCSLCSRAFASSSTLNMHMRVHTGEKPYSCPQCGKKFARSDMASHIRTHSGIKPYECPECKKKFTTSGQLNQHSKIHSGLKFYFCEVCNKAFSSPTYLKKHLKSHETNNDKEKIVEQEDENIESIIYNTEILQSENILGKDPENQLTLFTTTRQYNPNVKDECLEILEQQLIDTGQDSILAIDENNVITIVNNSNRVAESSTLSHIYQQQ